MSVSANLSILSTQTFLHTRFSCNWCSLQPNFEGILVLDEIGRMELLSDRFKDEVTKAFSNPSVTVLATIPVRPTAFTESLKQTPNSVVLMVSL
jgi:nucleoside-triphosphatase THEP1